MAKFNSTALADIKEAAKKSQYIDRSWKTDDSCTMTLQEFAELIDSTYKYVNDNPVIISKDRKDGKSFLKMWIPLEGDSGAEFDLSYEQDEFDEGDTIDKNSLKFCMERFFDKTHLYATGEII